MPRFTCCLALAAIALASMATPALGGEHGTHHQLTRVAGTPFPSNRFTVRDRTQATGLRVNLPKPDCTTHPSDCQDTGVLNTLDGFNLQPRLSIPFTGPIDVSSVSSGDVFLVRLHGREHRGSRIVGINQIVWDPATNTLHAESDQLLDQDTTYALVVTTGIRDANGRPIGPEGERGRIELRRMHKAFEHERRVHPAALSVFTTQSATALMEKIRAQLDAAPPSPASFDLGPNGARTVFSFPTVASVIFNRQLLTTGALSPTAVPTVALTLFPGSVGQLAFGSYQSPDYETASGEIPQVGTATGVPAVQSTNTIYFNLIIPSGPQPAGGWPVAIFGHGFGDNKNSSPFAVASTLAHQGIATIAINVVGHGFRPRGRPRRQRHIRLDRGRQRAPTRLDHLQPRRTQPDRRRLDAARADDQGGVDVDGDGSPDLSTSRIYYFGQSFGGIYGTELLGLDPLVHTGVLNVPGGAIVEIARLSPGFRPLVEHALATRTPSLLNGGFDGFTESIPLRDQPPVTNPAAGAMPIQEFIDNTEWASQSSNPVAWAPHVRLAPLPGAQPKNVIVQFARGDQTVPNPTASALIRAGRLTDRATFFRNDLAFAATRPSRRTRTPS